MWRGPLTCVIALAACAGVPERSCGETAEPPSLDEDGPMAERSSPSPWTDAFSPPQTLDTDRVHLEPLAPRHAERDHAALMGSREHLQRTLRWGDWPRPDFTVEENREDLARHWREFERREGYAYTVLTRDRARCVGCVYLEPLPDGGTHDAALAYWVVERELATELDRHLLAALSTWWQRDWGFSRVALVNHVDNARGLAVARALGYRERPGASPGGRADERLLVWTPGGAVTDRADD